MITISSSTGRRYKLTDAPSTVAIAYNTALKAAPSLGMSEWSRLATELEKTMLMFML